MDFSQVKQIQIPESDYSMKNIKLRGATVQGENPSPSNPQEIKVAQGHQVVTVAQVGETTSYPVDLQEATNLSPIDQGGIASGNGTNFWTAERVRNREFTPVAPSSDYNTTVADSAQFQICIFYYKDDSTYLGFSDWEDVPFFFTTPGQCGKIRAAYRKKNNDSIVPNEISDPILTNQFTTLARIGDFQDIIFKNIPTSPYYDMNIQNNAWVIRKEIKKYTLKESDVVGAYGRMYQVSKMSFPGAILQEKTTHLASSHFSVTDNWDIANVSTPGKFYSGASYINFNYDGSGNDVNGFKAWLTSNTVTVLAPLSTPTTTAITDARLISQLDALWAGGTFPLDSGLTISATADTEPAVEVKVADLLNDVAKIESGATVLWKKTQ